MNYDPTTVQRWSISLTNGSGTDRTLQFVATTNAWRFLGPTGLTNAPSLVTNLTQVVLNGVSRGTNTLVKYEFYAWP